MYSYSAYVTSEFSTNVVSYQHLSKIFIQFYHSQRLKPKQYSKHLITESQVSNRALVCGISYHVKKLCQKNIFLLPFFFLLLFWVTFCLCGQKTALNILQLKHNRHLLPVIFRYFLCSQFLCCQNCGMGGIVTKESNVTRKVKPILDFLRWLHAVTAFRKPKEVM